MLDDDRYWVWMEDTFDQTCAELFDLIKHHRAEAKRHQELAETLSQAYLKLKNWE